MEVVEGEKEKEKNLPQLKTYTKSIGLMRLDLEQMVARKKFIEV